MPPSAYFHRRLTVVSCCSAALQVVCGTCSDFKMRLPHISQDEFLRVCGR